jgi:K+-transporting ATPase KdpF subunit
MPAAEGAVTMPVLYAISGIIALALLVYLIIALFKPEWFK